MDHRKSFFPDMSVSTKLSPKQVVYDTQYTQSKAKVRLGKAHNELANQLWAQSDQRFVSNCAETAQPIRDQVTVETQIASLIEANYKSFMLTDIHFSNP